MIESLPSEPFNVSSKVEPVIESLILVPVILFFLPATASIWTTASSIIECGLWASVVNIFWIDDFVGLLN